jgi:leucyl aminopeptidase (aminopeptidase T)
MLDLLKGLQSILEACMPMQAGERVLVIAYNEPRSMLVGAMMMSIAESMGAETVLTVMTPREIAGQEPPASVTAAMKNVDAIIQVCEKASVAHTTARKEAAAAGIKFALMLDVPLDDLKKGVSMTEVQQVKNQTVRLANLLTKGKAAKITTPLGTDLTMSLEGREGIAINPLGPGLFTIPYYAEAAISPVEGTAEGMIVADLAMRGWGCLLREPLRYRVKAGRVVEIYGSTPDTDRMRKIAAADENAALIAELGIGSSHIVPGEMKGTTQDFARLGTLHVAIGRNNDIGGKTWSRIHQDGLMSRPTVEVDNVCILKDGVLQGEMRAGRR